MRGPDANKDDELD
jgi:hypothetical protein